jgi:hypothetical protein
MESGLNIDVQHLVIDSTSSIDVSGRGYLGGLQPGNPNCEGVTIGGLSGAGSYSGGSYGGLGGQASTSLTNPAYGNPSAPVFLGSGGACGSYSNIGGNGGGLVMINAAGSITVEGGILANGGSGQNYNAGSGSGGSINITTSLLQGTGVIQARGFAKEVGGGGGRIAVVYDALGADDFAALTNIDAAGGAGSNSRGSAGTVLLRQSSQAYGDLFIDAVSGSTAQKWTPLTHIGFGEIQALTEDTITFDGLVSITPGALVGIEINPNINQEQTFTVVSNTDISATVAVSGTALTEAAAVGDTYSGVYTYDNLFMRRGGFLVLGDKLKIQGELRIDEQSVLTHYNAALDWVSKLDITAQLLTITAGSSIDVNGRGYLGGLQSGNDCSGQTLGNIDGSAQYSGGSYGGIGGQASSGSPNPIYGSELEPTDLGSGGGCGSYSNTGGNGGGRIFVSAAEVVCNGAISADGTRGSSYSAGSGSGGSISISAGILSGSGAIGADGYGHEVGGGGGRVAVRYTSGDFPHANITAIGGNGSQADGTDGTVHIE